MNRVELTGGLVREPELRFTPGGAAVCELSVAVNEAGWSSEKREQVVMTTYVTCQAWLSKAEEIVEMNLSKGDEVYVIGSLSQSSYEDRDGKKQTKTRVRIVQLSGVRVRNWVGEGSNPNRNSAPERSGPPPGGYAEGEEPF